MILIVATVRVHPGKAAAYEAACRDIMPKVRAANPGILFYEAGRSVDEPDTYRVIEAYRDAAAMERHIASALLRDSFETLKEYIADIVIRRHDVIQ